MNTSPITLFITYEAQTATLLSRYGLVVVHVAAEQTIPGSYWGEAEAGLVDHRLFVRADTPLHSALHEACHFICMDERRRRQLDTDAGGDDLEEVGVCYLQAVLADHIAGYGRTALLRDMDAWGYSFRLGSAQRWFNEDADDARDWLIEHGVLDTARRPTWQLRRDPPSG